MQFLQIKKINSFYYNFMFKYIFISLNIKKYLVLYFHYILITNAIINSKQLL